MSAEARIRLERTGGVAGPIRRAAIEVDTRELRDEERARIDALLASAELSRLPDRFALEGYPDALECTLVVESGGARSVVRFRDGDGHPPVLDEIAQAVRELARRGG